MGIRDVINGYSIDSNGEPKFYLNRDQMYIAARNAYRNGGYENIAQLYDEVISLSEVEDGRSLKEREEEQSRILAQIEELRTGIEKEESGLADSSYDDLSIEELQQIIEQNNQQIENNNQRITQIEEREKKKELVRQILGQQRTIHHQEEVIATLEKRQREESNKSNSRDLG